MNINAVAQSQTLARPPRPYGQSPADLEPPRPRPWSQPQAFSQVGEVIGRLSTLQQNDPEGLKTTASDLSQALRAEAAKAPGAGSLQQALGRLADAFDRVVETGDLAALAPPPPEPRGGAGAYARQVAPPSSGDVQAMQQAMSFVASRLQAG